MQMTWCWCVIRLDCMGLRLTCVADRVWPTVRHFLQCYLYVTTCIANGYFWPGTETAGHDICLHWARLSTRTCSHQFICFYFVSQTQRLFYRFLFCCARARARVCVCVCDRHFRLRFGWNFNVHVTRIWSSYTRPNMPSPLRIGVSFSLKTHRRAAISPSISALCTGDTRIITLQCWLQRTLCLWSKPTAAVHRKKCCE